MQVPAALSALPPQPARTSDDATSPTRPTSPGNGGVAGAAISHAVPGRQVLGERAERPQAGGAVVGVVEEDRTNADPTMTPSA